MIISEENLENSTSPAFTGSFEFTETFKQLVAI